MDLVKWAFVHVATKEYAIPGKKMSTSRKAIITGLSRRDVQQMEGFSIGKEEDVLKKMTRSNRVVTGWMNNVDYVDPYGNPLALTIEGEEPNFTSLARKYSGDMPVRALIDELKRVGSVELKDDKVSLVTKGYVPVDGESEKLRFLAEDVSSLISTIDGNIYGVPPSSRLHKRIKYVCLSEKETLYLRKYCHRKAQEFLMDIDRWMHYSFKDENDVPEEPSESSNRKAGIVVYYFEETDSND